MYYKKIKEIEIYFSGNGKYAYTAVYKNLHCIMSEDRIKRIEEKYDELIEFMITENKPVREDQEKTLNEIREICNTDFGKFCNEQ